MICEGLRDAMACEGLNEPMAREGRTLNDPIACEGLNKPMAYEGQNNKMIRKGLIEKLHILITTQIV